MTDRDRLIELCNQKINTMKFNNSDHWFDFRERMSEIADYLLANGVIVPPCKVSDTLWILFTVEKTIESREIESIMQRHKSWTMRFTNGDCFTVWDNAEDEYFGKTVFLTKEEAEKALAERNKLNENSSI